MATHPLTAELAPPSSPIAYALTSGLVQCLRTSMPLDWILGRKVTAQAEVTRCRVKLTHVTYFSRNGRSEIQIDKEYFDTWIHYRYWVAGVCHHGKGRLPMLRASGIHQSKREVAKTVIKKSFFPVTYRTRRPSRSMLAQPLAA